MAQMNWFAKQKIDTDIENTRVDTKGRSGVGMHWEVGIGMYAVLTLRIK